MIPVTDAQALFTKELVARLSDQLKPKTFGRSFFIETESFSKNISLQVQRTGEYVAVDVVRGTEGNRNVFGKSTEKIFEPPLYDEYFDMTELDGYDKLYVDPEIAEVNFNIFLDNAAAQMDVVMDKVERAYELQAWQVFLTGTVTLKHGDNINFRRKAASLVDLGAGNYWDGGSVDPNTSLLVGAEFLRQIGKAPGSVINMVLGTKAMAAFLANTAVINRAKGFQYGMDAILPAQRNALGQTYRGEITVDSYTFRLWLYNEIYSVKDATTGIVTNFKYMDEKSVVLLPEVTKNVLSYAAVPQLLSTGIVPKKGKFLAYEFVDPRLVKHLMGVKSAGVAIPVAVDQIYTMKVLG